MRLLDTAGLRVATDAVEQLGVERARAAAAAADIIVLVYDAEVCFACHERHLSGVGESQVLSLSLHCCWFCLTDTQSAQGSGRCSTSGSLYV